MEQLKKVLLYSSAVFLALSLLWWQLLFNGSTVQQHFPVVHLFTQLCVLGGLAVVAWTGGYFIYDLLHSERVAPSAEKVVLITGCDSGFGHRLARRLDALGFTVVAGVLAKEGEGAKELAERCSSRLRVLPMDVTKVEDVKRVVGELQQMSKQRQQQQPKQLWAVVNNAGIALGLPFDWGRDVECYQRTFDVNVFGLVRVTKFAMPLLRANRGSRVVNVASVAGRITAPLIGHYCMAKHSVRVFSDVLRRELLTDGVQVVTIEPTFYQTPIVNFEQINRTRERLLEETEPETRAAYSPSKVRSMMNMEKLVNVVTRTNVDEVVDALERAVTLKSPKLFYRCAGYHEVLVWAVSHLPEAILDFLVSGIIYNKYSTILAKRYISLFRGDGKQKKAKAN